MNEAQRGIVENFLSKRNTKPLYFGGLYSLSNLIETTEINDKLSLDDLVIKVLKYAKLYNSFIIDKKDVDTGPGRNRSSLDIWRHVKYFRPDTTIFDVMHSLYNIVDYKENGLYKIASLYCNNIRRRVFCRSDTIYRNVYNETTSDEYGLTFKFWEDI